MSMDSIGFMEKHLEDACEEEYEALCKQVIEDLKRLQLLEAKSNFKEEIYEIAFGDNAINRDWPESEVIDTIRSYSDQSHAATELILTNFSSIEDFEKAKLEYLEKYVA